MPDNSVEKADDLNRDSNINLTDADADELSPLEEFAAEASKTLESRQVDMTDSSAHRVEGGQIRMERSSAQNIQASAVHMDESAGNVVRAGVVDARESLIGITITDEAMLHDVTNSVLIGRTIEAQDVRVGLLVGGRINGMVTTLFTPRTALALGAGIYLTWLFINKIFIRLPLISWFARRKSE